MCGRIAGVRGSEVEERWKKEERICDGRIAGLGGTEVEERREHVWQNSWCEGL